MRLDVYRRPYNRSLSSQRQPYDTMTVLPLLLAIASSAFAAVCPRGFLVHPAANTGYCLSSPGADKVNADSEYTLGILV